MWTAGSEVDRDPTVEVFAADSPAKLDEFAAVRA
jgi:hypothetical protein